MLFFVQVITYLSGELLGEFHEPIGGWIHPTELFDELLGLVVIRQCVATDGEPGVIHQQRDVEVTFLGRRVRVEFVGERQERGSAVLDRSPSVGHRAGKCSLDLVARSQVLEDRHPVHPFL